MREPVEPQEQSTVESDAVGINELDLKALTRSLLVSLGTCSNREAARVVLTGVIRQLMNPSAIHLWRVTQDGQVASVNGADLTLPHEELGRLCLANVVQASRTGETSITELDRRRNLVSLSLPIGLRVTTRTPAGEPLEVTEVLSVVLLLGTEPLESFLVIFQLLCGYLTHWEARTSAQQSHELAQVDQFLLKTIVQMTESGSGPAAARVCVEELRKILPTGLIAIGLGDGESCHLLGLSGAAEIDRRSPLSQAVQGVLKQAVRHSQVRAWLSSNEYAVNDPLAELSRQQGLAHILSGPLREVDGRVVGSWLIATEESLEQQPVVRSALVRGERAITRIVTRRDRWGSVQAAAQPTWLRQSLPWLVPLVVGSALLLPVPFRVSCDVQVQPVQRRVIAAPFAGILREVNAEAGDTVQAGDVLARMDDTELRLEHAELQADVDRLTRSQDVNRAEGKEVEAILDGHKLTQAEARLALLQSRLSHLDLTSPVSGVILSEDLKRAEGIPVRVGQSLFEVAPLDNMRVELRIPVDQIDQIEVGQSVQIGLISQPGGPLLAQVDRLLPTAETVDGVHVFLALASLPDQSPALRPGENGQAQITIGQRSLWWVLFHRPWQKLRTQWSW